MDLLSTACFGNEACQEQRAIDQQRQLTELELLTKETDTKGGISTGAFVGIILAVLVFLGVMVFMIIKKKGKKG